MTEISIYCVYVTYIFTFTNVIKICISQICVCNSYVIHKTQGNEITF